MDNKLSELSKPVATVDVQRGRPDGNMFGVAWSSAGHAMPDGPHFLYSQEYVSALLAELEAKDQAHRVHAARLISERGVLRERVTELEAKLATPVRLPGSFYPDGDIDCPLVVELDAAVEAIRAAGFTVEGDE